MEIFVYCNLLWEFLGKIFQRPPVGHQWLRSVSLARCTPDGIGSIPWSTINIQFFPMKMTKWNPEKSHRKWLSILLFLRKIHDLLCIKHHRKKPMEFIKKKCGVVLNAFQDGSKIKDIC